MPKPVRVRFAPSPTGLLHVGNARTALFNFLFARRMEGAFILRVEDTDQARSTKEFEEALLQDLRWLGLEWDEGPERSGNFGPYRQSERWDLYRRYAAELAGKKKAYPCYCTEEELEEKRRLMLARGIPPRYDGRCRNLDPGEERSLIESGRSPSLRFRVEDRSVEFEDLVRGRMSFDGQKIGDFVVLRSGGTASYNFAAVVDDSLMKVTHIIRGEDHLANTARQFLLYRALEFPPPQFGHLSLILGADRAPLSKRHGVTSVSHFREAGYLPEALANYLALLGWSSAGGQEIFTMGELRKNFSLDRLSRSPAVFDQGKLNWVNRAHLKRFHGKEALELAKPFLRKSGLNVEGLSPSWLISALETVWAEVDTLSQLGDRLGFLLDEGWFVEPEARRVLSQEETRRLIRGLKDELNSLEKIEPQNCRQILSRLAQRVGRSGKGFFLPLRAVLTGRTHGPELEKVFVLLGKEKILQRADWALKQNGTGRNESSE